MDPSGWPDFARRAAAGLDMTARDGPEEWMALFGPDGTYEDPVTSITTDLAGVFAVTRATMPDWTMEVTGAAGDRGRGAMEWIGRGTLAGGGPAIVLPGCTVLEVDDAGRIRRWRDYFDLTGFERQAGVRT
jgi:limonene-1,2-epoxide hydrolase